MRVVISERVKWLAAGALMLVLATPLGLRAQGNPDPFGFKFNSGQGLQPIFEGWAKNPDGTFEMWYGYYNRNFVETLVIPLGPDNKVGLGVADRGQPTLFLPRIHRKAFHATVPADFGKKELTWTVTAHGETEKAIGWLQREWEIDPIYAGKERNAESLKNTAPKLTLDVATTVTLPGTLALSATVVDDGLPKPRPAQARGTNDPPSLKALADQPEIPVNVPSVGGRGRGAGGGGGGGGGGPQLAVNWVAFRGPAPVTFAQATTTVKDQKAATTATFTKAGTYVFRITANDGELTVDKDVTVTVK